MSKEPTTYELIEAIVAQLAPREVPYVPEFGGAVLEALKQEIVDRSRKGVTGVIGWRRRRRATPRSSPKRSHPSTPSSAR